MTGVAPPRARCHHAGVVPPNRLARETSPYLLQPAHNPVDWFGWGEEAFGRARVENKPILLSVGYSACHWCHVMERESFANPDIARLMNELFISVKVDREERPDIDDVYMKAVQALTGRGGWPMTVFLTPEGKPFYGGTYFPPVDRHGLPGFPRVLQAVARAYREQPDEVAGSVDRIFSALEGVEQPRPSEGPLDPTLPRRAAEGLVGLVDRHHGGRQGRGGRQVLRVDAGGGRAPRRRGRRRARLPVLGHHAGGQLRGQEHPARDPVDRDGGEDVRAKPRGCGRRARAGPCAPARGARRARPSPARREGPDQLERARDRHVRRGGPRAPRAAVRRRRRRGRRVRVDAA